MASPPHPVPSPAAPRPGRRRPRAPLAAALLAAAALAGALLAACGGAAEEPAAPTPAASAFVPRERAPEGPPRAYRLGFTATPAQLSDEAYASAFDLAAHYGEAIVVPRVPRWAAFLPGTVESEELIAVTVAERDAAAARGLALVVALDPFDPADRGRLAGLPPGYEARYLSDPALHQAFVAEARYIATNERPAYLSLATEVNSTFERDPIAYRQFLAVYRDAYRAVKEASPETRVFVTLQYEELLGVIPWLPPHVPRWELLDDFAGRLDLVAISSFPSFAFAVARKVPPDYYLQLAERTDAPLAFLPVGFAGAPGRDGVNSSTTAEQRRFLQRLLVDADALPVELLVWYLGRDPAYEVAPPADLLASTGLRDAQDAPKEAWSIWEQAVSRPLAAPAPAASPAP